MNGDDVAGEVHAQVHSPHLLRFGRQVGILSSVLPRLQSFGDGKEGWSFHVHPPRPEDRLSQRVGRCISEHQDGFPLVGQSLDRLGVLAHVREQFVLTRAQPGTRPQVVISPILGLANVPVFDGYRHTTIANEYACPPPAIVLRLLDRPHATE